MTGSVGFTWQVGAARAQPRCSFRGAAGYRGAVIVCADSHRHYDVYVRMRNEAQHAAECDRAGIDRFKCCRSDPDRELVCHMIQQHQRTSGKTWHALRCMRCKRMICICECCWTAPSRHCSGKSHCERRCT